MTTARPRHLHGPPGPSLHPPHRPQPAVRRRDGSRRPASDRHPDATAGQSRDRARPVRLDVRAPSSTSPSAPSRRPSPGSGRTTDSAWWSTTTGSMSWSPSTPATADARHEAVERLADPPSRGSTNLGEGWLRGCEQVAAHLTTSGVDRCLLLTDGLANVGITDAGELAAHAAALRDRGVSTSTFGVGERLRRATAGRPRRRGRWSLLLHRRCPADPRRHHLGGRGDPRDRGPRRHHRAHGPRRHPDRCDHPAAGQRPRRAHDRVRRGPRLRAGRRGRAAPVVPVRRDRPGDRRDRRARRSRRRLRDRCPAPAPTRSGRVDLRGPPDQRRPGTRPRGRSGRGAGLRGPGAAGGRRAQPGRPIRRGDRSSESTGRADPRLRGPRSRTASGSWRRWSRRRPSTRRRWRESSRKQRVLRERQPRPVARRPGPLGQAHRRPGSRSDA